MWVQGVGWRNITSSGGGGVQRSTSPPSMLRASAARLLRLLRQMPRVARRVSQGRSPWVSPWQSRPKGGYPGADLQQGAMVLHMCGGSSASRSSSRGQAVYRHGRRRRAHDLHRLERATGRSSRRSSMRDLRRRVPRRLQLDDRRRGARISFSSRHRLPVPVPCRSTIRTAEAKESVVPVTERVVERTLL